MYISGGERCGETASFILLGGLFGRAVSPARDLRFRGQQLWAKYFKVKKVLHGARFTQKRLLVIHNAIESSTCKYNLATRTMVEKEADYIDGVQKKLYRAVLQWPPTWTHSGAMRSVKKIRMDLTLPRRSHDVRKRRVQLAHNILRRSPEHPTRRVLVTQNGQQCGPLGRQLPAGRSSRVTWLQLVAQETGIPASAVCERATLQDFKRMIGGTPYGMYRVKFPLPALDEEERLEARLHHFRGGPAEERTRCANDFLQAKRAFWHPPLVRTSEMWNLP